MVKQSNYWFDTHSTRIKPASGVVKNADVLIIGGGIAGITLLYHLINAGLTNTYLVEEASVGYHASGRSSGHLTLRGQPLFSELPEEQAVPYAKFIHQGLIRMTKGLRESSFDSELNECGGLRLATTLDEFSLLEQEAKFIGDHLNIDCPILGRKAVAELTRSSHFFGGMFVPHECAFNPYKVVNGVADLISRRGHRILSNCQVESVVPTNGDSLAVSIRHKGTIRAKRVVYCTNAYTHSLLPDTQDCLQPFRGQIAITDSLDKEVIDALPPMALSCNNGSEYFRLCNGRLLVGGMRHSIRGQQEGILYDGEISRSVYDRLRDFVMNVLPALKGTKFTHTWTGIMCSTPDGLPLLGPVPDKPNQFMMCGFNGYGFSHALMSSLVLKDYLVNGSSHIVGTDLFSPQRFIQ